MLDERDMPIISGDVVTISLPASDAAIEAEESAEVAVSEADVDAAVAPEVATEEAPAAEAAARAALQMLKLPDALASDGRFNTFYAALDLTANIYTLKLDEQFTIFAPTDSAFGALPERVLLGWQNNPDALRRVLLHHIVPGRRFVENIPFDMPVDTLNRDVLAFKAIETEIVIDDLAAMVDNDIAVANGVIHAVDSVLFPPFDVEPPTIDGSGAATFAGSELTVVGFAEPGADILVELNGERFGTATADWQGEWRVRGAIVPGEYTILAWSFDVDDVLQGVSAPVELTVVE